MKRVVQCSLVVSLMAIVLGCSAAEDPAGPGGARPADFAIEYRWREGSLPPPYHYEYTLTVSAAGAGEIVVTPDYPRADVPTWTETFAVSAAELDRLYKLMADNGLFRRSWRQEPSPPVGGSSQSLVVTAGGKRFTVEDFLVADQQAAAKAMWEAVRAVAPREAWDRLDSQREQYVKEHER